MISCMVARFHQRMAWPKVPCSGLGTCAISTTLRRWVDLLNRMLPLSQTWSGGLCVGRSQL
jgi:hypothetical protein